MWLLGQVERRLSAKEIPHWFDSSSSLARLELWYNHQMKICSKCHIEKEDDKFAYRDQTGGVRHRICKSCHDEYGKLYWKNHKDHLQDLQKKRRGRTREFLNEYLKSHPCVDCGCNDIRVLQFDHVNGGKIDSVSVMSQRRLSTAELVEEIKKCEVRCANCHIIRHHEERRKGDRVQFESG